MPSQDDSITLQEVGRTLNDFRNEMRSQLQQLVRADVYRAEQAADRARIGALEKAAEREEIERTASRRQMMGAVVASVGSLVVALVVLVVSIAVK